MSEKTNDSFGDAPINGYMINFKNSNGVYEQEVSIDYDTSTLEFTNDKIYRVYYKETKLPIYIEY